MGDDCMADAVLSAVVSASLVLKHNASVYLCLVMQDVAKFFLLSGLVQLIIYLVLVPTFVRSHASAKSILLQLLLSVLNAAEPILPAVVVFVRVSGLLRLRWQGIIVSDTQKMLTAGHLDIMMFDKTGTLTVEQVSVFVSGPTAYKARNKGRPQVTILVMLIKKGAAYCKRRCRILQASHLEGYSCIFTIKPNLVCDMHSIQICCSNSVRNAHHK